MSCFFCVIYAVFKVEISTKDKICKCKVGMVKEIMEGVDKMQVLCEILVQPLIPIGQITFHTYKLIELHVYIVRKE